MIFLLTVWITQSLSRQFYLTWWVLVLIKEFQEFVQFETPTNCRVYPLNNYFHKLNNWNNTSKFISITKWTWPPSKRKHFVLFSAQLFFLYYIGVLKINPIEIDQLKNSDLKEVHWVNLGEQKTADINHDSRETFQFTVAQPVNYARDVRRKDVNFIVDWD